MLAKPIPSIITGVNNIAVADSLNQIKDRLYNCYQKYFKDVEKDDFYPILVVNRENVELSYNVIKLWTSENQQVLLEMFKKNCERFHETCEWFARSQIGKEEPARIRPVLLISTILSEDDEEFVESLQTEMLGAEGVMFWEKEEERRSFFTLCFSFVKYFRQQMQKDFDPFVILLSPIYTVDFASYVYQKGVNFLLKSPKLEGIASFDRELISALQISHFAIDSCYKTQN